MLRKIRGQSTLEYGLIIAAVVAALLAVNYYMKRGVQGKLKESTDEIGKQFEPTSFTSSWKSESSGTTVSKEERNVGAGIGATEGTTTSTIESAETVTRSEHEKWGTEPGQHY